MDFKNMIGNLFFDRAKNVPAAKQLSEDLVNSMYGTSFQTGAYRMVTLCAANLENPDLQELDDRMQRCGQQLIQRLTPECRDVLYHFDHLRIRILLNYPAEKDAHILFLLRSQVQAVSPMQNGIRPIVVCCSRCHQKIVEINVMLEETGNIMWTRFASREPMLVHPDVLTPSPERARECIFAAEQTLKSACSLLDLDAFQKCLDGFFSLSEDVITCFETRLMLRHVEYDMFEVNRDLISSFSDAGKASREMVLQLRTATSLEAYKCRYKRYLTELLQQIISHSTAHLSRPVRKAQRYIQEHYARPLRLVEVASHVGLTPVYLCSRFRQEVGMGFSDYCNRCRIDQAKHLLRETERPIVEISRSVGYSGPRYFSRVFKELEGMQPSKYRARSRRKQQSQLL